MYGIHNVTGISDFMKEKTLVEATSNYPSQETNKGVYE